MDGWVETGAYIGDGDENRVSVVATADAVTVNDGESEVVIPHAMVRAVTRAMEAEKAKALAAQAAVEVSRG